MRTCQPSVAPPCPGAGLRGHWAGLKASEAVQAPLSSEERAARPGTFRDRRVEKPEPGLRFPHPKSSPGLLRQPQSPAPRHEQQNHLHEHAEWTRASPKLSASGVPRQARDEYNTQRTQRGRNGTKLEYRPDQIQVVHTKRDEECECLRATSRYFSGRSAGSEL